MLKIGEKIDEYELIELLGHGATGSVYKSRHPILGHDIAIKILGRPPEESNERHLHRFRREARLASTLKHSAIATPLAFGLSAEGAFIVYEYVPGRNLAVELASGKRFGNEEIVSLMVQLFSALKNAHDNDIVHRDVKPSNIMITDTQELKLLDFGAGKWSEPETEINQRLTATAELIGTSAYMSPEQCRGAAVDGRSDLYSAGCVLYEILAGTPPFSGSTTMEVMLMHANAEVKPIKAKRPQDLKDICFRLLAKRPDARFENAQAVIDALKAADTTSSTTEHAVSPSRKKLIAALSALMVLAAGATAWHS